MDTQAYSIEKSGKTKSIDFVQPETHARKEFIAARKEVTSSAETCIRRVEPSTVTSVSARSDSIERVSGSKACAIVFASCSVSKSIVKTAST